MSTNKKSINISNKLLRIMAAIVDIGLSSVVSLIILQMLRQNGINGSIIWFIMICFIVFELRDVIGKRSIGKRIFGLYIICPSSENSSVSILRLLVRNVMDFIFPLVLFQIYKYGEKNGDKVTKTNVCNIQEYGIQVLA